MNMGEQLKALHDHEQDNAKMIEMAKIALGEQLEALHDHEQANAKMIEMAKIAKRVKADGGGLRYNAGKVMVELIPPEWTWALAVVLTRGAAKYAVRNWERGMKWSYPLGCIFRHVLKFMCGEHYDAETGCHHMALAAWNCLALMSYDVRQVGENDIGLIGDLKWMDRVAQAPGPELAAKMASSQSVTGSPPQSYTPKAEQRTTE